MNPDGIDFAPHAEGVASLVREIESGRGAHEVWGDADDERETQKAYG